MQTIPIVSDLDRQILDLIHRRQRILAEKTSAGTQESGLVDALRAIDAMPVKADTALSEESQRSILRHIVSACHHAARPERIAFLGPTDSYSHLAAIAYFGESTMLTPVPSIAAVFDAVDRRDCQHGIVPIENSTDGRVVDTLAKLAGGSVNLTGELLMAIHHNLLSRSPREDIAEVHSKPQALSQCRGWLADHLPDAVLVETASTAAAAEAASQQPGIAAIASNAAATRFGLPIVAPSIEDNRHNVTRFAVLGSGTPKPTGEDKTTLLFQVHHRPGALAEVMGIFRDHQLNLTWIESFPQPGRPNEYFFVVEFPGHQAQSEVATAIDQLRQQTLHVGVLGSYPCGRRV